MPPILVLVCLCAQPETDLAAKYVAAADGVAASRDADLLADIRGLEAALALGRKGRLNADLRAMKITPAGYYFPGNKAKLAWIQETEARLAAKRAELAARGDGKALIVAFETNDVGWLDDVAVVEVRGPNEAVCSLRAKGMSVKGSGASRTIDPGRPSMTFIVRGLSTEGWGEGKTFDFLGPVAVVGATPIKDGSRTRTILAVEAIDPAAIAAARAQKKTP